MDDPVVREKTGLEAAFERAQARIDRLPKWLQPMATGGGILFLAAGWRMIFVLPLILVFAVIEGPHIILQFLQIIVGATAAGVMGGAAFTVVNRPLRWLGRVGSCVICTATIGAYLLTAIVLFNGLGSEPEPINWAAWAGLSTLFGVTLGIGLGDPRKLPPPR